MSAIETTAGQILDIIKSRDIAVKDLGSQITVLQQEIHTMIFRCQELHRSITNLTTAVQSHNDRLDVVEHKIKVLQNDQHLAIDTNYN